MLSLHKNTSSILITTCLGLLFYGFGNGFLALQGQVLHTDPSCTTNKVLTTLEWQSSPSDNNEFNWSPAGALSYTATNVGGSGHQFSFNLSGSTSYLNNYNGLTPNIQGVFSDFVVDALCLYVDPGFGSSNNITLTISISPAIPGNAAFDLYHINGSAYSGDKMTVTARTEGGTTIYPTLTDNGSPSWQDLGNGVADATGSGTSGTDDQVGVNFNSADNIDQITIVWEECGICGSGVHGMGIGAISFCGPPPADEDGDNMISAIDIDDDNDGIRDFIELCGISATDFSCMPGGLDPGGDADNDGVLNYLDANDVSVGNSCTDANADGICDAVPSVYDTDGDNIPDHLDLDADNDGIPDIIEAGGTDSDNDGRVDGFTDVSVTENYSDAASCSNSPLTISSPSTWSSPGDDDYLSIPLPFTFDFYGTSFSGNIYLFSNGLMSFDNLSAYAGNTWSPSAFPSSTYTNTIAINWTDMSPNAGGTIQYGTNGSSPNRIFIIDFNNVPTYAGNANNTFQLQLFETSNEIKIVTTSFSPNSYELRATQGFNKDGSTAHQYTGRNNTNYTISSADCHSGAYTAGQDADGWDDNVAASPYARTNSDSDSQMDFLDLDSDNDGIPDLIEVGGTDTDGNGLVEQITASLDLSNDSDGDGWTNLFDGDTDNNGAQDNSSQLVTGSLTNAANFDADANPNHLDTDADGDAIPDLIESRGIDTDGNGLVDSYADSDGDGLHDLYDPINNQTAASTSNDALILTGTDANANGLVNGSEGYADGDNDADTYPNFLDRDSENDGILDSYEKDGVGGATIIRTGPDTDSDGHPDSYATGDQDSDVSPNFLDNDADNDGIPDFMEAQATGETGTQCYIVPNSTVDGYGLPTVFVAYQNCNTSNQTTGSPTYGISPYNHDGDSSPDYIDTDADNDGLLDVHEAWDGVADADILSDITFLFTDNDLDGMDACFDGDDNDGTDRSHSTNPPIDNGFKSVVNGGSTNASSFASLDGNTVLFSDVFPNNHGDQTEIQPDWRDDITICTNGASAVYPITGSDAIFSADRHTYNPSATEGSIRAYDGCNTMGEAGWTYYLDPINPTKAVFAIYHGSNTTAIDFVELRRDLSTDRHQTNNLTGNATEGSFVMARDWYVQTEGGAALTAPVKVRFYYDAQDSLDVSLVGETYSNQVGRVMDDPVWFKIDHQFANSEISSANGLADASGYAVMDVESYGMEFGCHYVQFQNVNNFSGGGMALGIDNFLPVEWGAFQAILQRDHIQLDWETLTESQTDRFEVERSMDGHFFSHIGSVQANGNSSEPSQYQFQDRAIGHIVLDRFYYRLKQIDLNGQFSYSNVEEVQIKSERLPQLIIYPNPVNQALTIKFSILQPADLTVRIFNAVGQEMFTKDLMGFYGIYKREIAVTEWTNGLYFVELSSENERSVFKVLVE